MIIFEQERAAFFHQMGDALSSWAGVETILFGLFSRSFPRSEWAALYGAFIAVENFRSRLQMIDTIIREKYKEKIILERWAALSKRLATESKNRNYIAHRPTQQYLDGRVGRRFGLIDRADTLLPIYRRSTAVTKVELNSNPRKIPPPQGTLFIKDITRAKERWRALSINLMSLDLYLGGLIE